MQEIWKDIIGYDGVYQISNLGNVKSKNVSKKCGHYYSESHILKQSPTPQGYCQVTLYDKNRKRKKYSVHKLVADAFIPNPNNYPCVNHKDENKTNNCVSNLEWCSYEYNNAYGTARIRQIETTSRKIEQFTLEGHWIATYLSVSIASKIVGIATTSIKDCCNGKHPFAGGYIWKYTNESNNR